MVEELINPNVKGKQSVMNIDVESLGEAADQNIMASSSDQEKVILEEPVRGRVIGMELILNNQLAQLIYVELYKSINDYLSIVTVVNTLLSISCHDTLNRYKVICVSKCWSQLHWYIWSIDVTCVKHC